jgi:hypothetical protein
MASRRKSTKINYELTICFNRSTKTFSLNKSMCAEYPGSIFHQALSANTRKITLKCDPDDFEPVYNLLNGQYSIIDKELLLELEIDDPKIAAYELLFDDASMEFNRKIASYNMFLTGKIQVLLFDKNLYTQFYDKFAEIPNVIPIQVMYEKDYGKNNAAEYKPTYLSIYDNVPIYFDTQEQPWSWIEISTLPVTNGNLETNHLRELGVHRLTNWCLCEDKITKDGTGVVSQRTMVGTKKPNVNKTLYMPLDVIGFESIAGIRFQSIIYTNHMEYVFNNTQALFNCDEVDVFYTKPTIFSGRKPQAKIKSTTIPYTTVESAIDALEANDKDLINRIGETCAQYPITQRYGLVYGFINIV